MGTAVLGRISLALESLTNPGEQLIYSGTVASLPASATTQPNAIGGSSLYVGSRLLVVVSGNSTTGVISIAGKDFSQAQNAITEVTPTVAVAGSASNPNAFGYEYVTTNVFSTINASGITLSSGTLTGGTVKIYAFPGTRSTQPAMLDAEEKIPPFSPQEQRGLASRNTNIQRLNKIVDISKFDTVLYPDTDAWWFGRMVVGSNPIQTFLPASASVLVIHASVAVSGFPVSATTQPNVLGPYAQLQFVVSGSGATGSFTVAGVNSAGVAVTETITCSGTNGNGTYTSVNFFQTINATGIGGALSGLTGGSVVVNGLYPTQLLAVTAVSSLPASLSTQPNTLGPTSLLQITASGSSAVGAIKIAGTNLYGQAITETVLCGVPGAANGNGTFYTQQAFATVNASGVTLVSGLTSGSIEINGILALQETYNAAPTNAGDQLQTATIEWYTGTDAVSIPFSFLTEVTLEGSPEKEIKLSAKGMAQDMLDIGSRSTTPLTASTVGTQFGAVGAFSATGGTAGGLWQPFDIGLSGWQSQFFIDALSGTAGTTGYNSVLDWKLTFKIPQKETYTTVNSQRMQRLYRQQRETEIDLTIDFIDLIQYEQFRQNIKQLFQLQIIGPALGVVGSTAYSKLWQFTFAAKIHEFKRDPSKMEKVEAKLKATAEYTLNVGGAGVNYEYQLVQITQIAPNYAS